MTDKKNIERLFQEKFKDFEVNPAPEAWDNIAARLEQKENKKRVFPFWFNAKAAGIAAALVLGFWGLNNESSFFTPWTLNLEGNKNETVVVQETNNNSKASSSENTAITSTKSDVEQVSTTQESSAVASTNNEVVKGNNKGNYENTSNLIVTSSAQSSSQNTKKEKTTPFNSNKNIQPSFKYFNNSNEVFVSNEKNKKQKASKTQSETPIQNNSSLAIQENEAFQKSEKTSATDISISNEKERFVKNQKSSKAKRNKNNTAIASKNNITDENLSEKAGNKKGVKSTSDYKIQNNSSVANNDKDVVQDKEKTTIEKTSISTEKEPFVKKHNNSMVGIEKNNTSDEVIKNNTTITPSKSTAVVAIDSSKIKAIEENPLEKILREKEKEKLAQNTEEKKEKTKSDWLIKPTIAPIFMFAKNGSPIDEKFVDNAKSYNNTVSVGIGLEKRLSDKFYFRTSVNNLDLSYNTNDIAYYSTLNIGGDPHARGLGNVSVNQSALFTTIVDSRDASFNSSEVLQNKKEGYLNQKISYVEIPFEVSYKIVDKKLGIQVMTGLSTLFLNKNQVSLVSEKFSSDLGEANNLNVVHFSTNIGLGFKYKFFKSFEASVEPTLKYQLFTFHTDSGGFKPYIIGLYSGVSYRF
ncbi:hypothetical protein EQG63_03985 [Flavobacterium amnicola]|uniref:Outer membrane protein beta-barrel domain-containing protein n=1 Tax=Flavobacterium amnicola TaxID=2506422 RepID=A0A4Q1K933_9FLAO|nr:outer membrane beta-barrel protein [Flavobacterium amnicola]RXR21109.1 hypothetical protein EQG63_03985 [Flavobacterium amnicola]